MTKKLPNGRGSVLFNEELQQQIIAGDAVILGYGNIGYYDILADPIT